MGQKSIRLFGAATAVAIFGGLSACAMPPGGVPCVDVPFFVGNPPAPPTPIPAGWYTSDTRTNGTSAINTDLGNAPGLTCKSVKLTTGASTASPSQDKAQLFTFDAAGTPLSSINTISYWAYRSSLSPAVIANPVTAATMAFNVQIYGAPSVTFATLVYEPYSQVGGAAAILNDTWQQWDATAGKWWSTTNGQSNLLTWAQVQALYPGALVGGYGLNLGSVNPNLIVGGDGIVFGSTSTDF